MGGELRHGEARLGKGMRGYLPTILPTNLPTYLPAPHTYTCFRPLPGLPFLVPIVFVSVGA